MIDTVFISDLHLHPEEEAIGARFSAFIEWAKISVNRVYILGDFFHAWVGDDSLDDWSRGIAEQVHSLSDEGIKVYYLHGNRDFLLGKTFARLAGWEVLNEPAFITLGSETIMLMHGDSYCTKDIAHQRFRRLTRNRLFRFVFLHLPLAYRKQLADRLRKRSMMDTTKSMEVMDVVAETVINHMQHHKTRILIHGHTHKCGLTTYKEQSMELSRYVLSDWDDNPQLLCYDYTKGFYFISI
ncbi:MAG: UDP-2,3-diacylglucosamine diphosphatase [Legionellales bacterium]